MLALAQKDCIKAAAEELLSARVAGAAVVRLAAIRHAEIKFWVWPGLKQHDATTLTPSLLGSAYMEFF